MPGIGRTYVVVMAATLVLHGGAAAQEATAEVASDRDAEARRLFETGNEAFSDGHFELAASAFERAYELSGRAPLLFNVGAAYDRLLRADEAIRAYEAYLEQVPDASNRAFVLSRIETLRTATAPPDDAPAPALPAATEEEEPAITSKWWFWTLLGAAVAGGVVAAVLLTSDPGVEDPPPGTIPTVFALELP